jgi:tripartite-type tricarboxylate transporter receptor subunit TctC
MRRSQDCVPEAPSPERPDNKNGRNNAMNSIGRRGALCLALAAPFVSREARAQADWPSRPLRFVVPFTAGGGGDTSARALAARTSEILGQNIVIENRTGGNAVVAANSVLQSPRDGYSYLVDAANQITNPFLVRDLPFDYRTAFVPVTMTARFPQVVAVRHDFPARTIGEFIDYVRARPGTVSCGTPPAAGAGHLALELLQQRAGIRFLHAPYRGGADAARDITGGQIDSVILTSSTIRGPVQAGKARVLAMTSAERSPAYPDAPTLDESGYPGFEMDDWNGLFAAEGAPTGMLPKLLAAMSQAARDPNVQARMAPLGTVLVINDTQEFNRWLARQRHVVEEVIKTANITLG